MSLDAVNLMAAPGALTPVGRASTQAGRRHYIDGVRAIAILAVIGFHAQIPGFHGGFIGVDVFFVISGFLISGQIAAQMLDRRFTAVDFYARRMLRILPPLLLVTLVTLAVARLFPLVPTESRGLANSAAATAAMISNYYFTTGTEYFDIPAEINPLLHTWSLGIEEQYYLFVPAVTGLAMMLAYRRNWKPVNALITACAIAIALSYVTMAILVKFDHRLAFYSIMSRAWQFAFGAMLALAVLNGTTIPKRLASLFGIAGLLGILASVPLYSEHMEYPGYFAACVPTLGTVLLLASGLDNEDSLITRGLASRPFVAVGLISYSWYLWHWPLVELARTLPVGEDSIWKNVASSGVALLLSIPTYLFLERPLKALRRREITDRYGCRIIAGGIAGSAAVALGALLLARSPGYQHRLQPIHLGQPSESLTDCRSGEGFPNLSHIVPCIVGADGDAKVLFWGDSHAWKLMPIAEWSALAADRAAAVLSSPVCPPLQGVETDYLAIPICAANNDKILVWLRNRPSITGIVLAARWNFYNDRDTLAGESNLPHLFWSNSNRSGSGYATLLSGGLTDLITSLTAQRRVLIVAPVPEFRHTPVDCLLRRQLTGQPPQSCAMARVEVERRRSDSMRVLRQVASGFTNVRIVDPLDAFCDGETCWPFGPEGVFYEDNSHLSPLGAEKLYWKFKEDFQWVYAGGRPTSP